MKEHVGACPRLQGRWAFIEGTDRPDWHPLHRNPEWIRDWEAGYKAEAKKYQWRKTFKGLWVYKEI